MVRSPSHGRHGYTPRRRGSSTLVDVLSAMGAFVLVVLAFLALVFFASLLGAFFVWLGYEVIADAGDLSFREALGWGLILAIASGGASVHKSD